MHRIELPDGRWLEFSRPMYISDKQKIVDLEAKELKLLERMNGYAEILGPAVSAKSWDGSLTDMTEVRLLTLFSEWAEFTEDDAVPKASGSPSTTTSPSGAPRSPAPRSNRSRSGTRRSG